MAKNYTKLFKILEHLGEGTISEIENKVKDEDKIIEDIKSDLGIEEETDLNLDDILEEDLKTIGENSDISEEKVVEQFSEQETEKAESLEENKEESLEESLEDINLEELDLSTLEKKEESEVQEEEEFKAESLEKERVVNQESGNQEIDIEKMDQINKQQEMEEGNPPSIEEPAIDLGDLETETASLDEIDSSIESEIEKPEDEIKAEEKMVENPEETEVNLSEEKELENLEELNLEENIDLGELEEKLEPEISEKKEKELNFEELENIEIKPEKVEGKEPVEEKDEFIDLSDLQEIAGIEEEEGEKEGEEIVISDEDLEIIKNTLKNDYPVWLSKEIKNLILNDALASNELKTLLDLIISGTNYKDVERYLEKTLNIKVKPAEVEEKVYIPSTYEIVFPYIKWITISIFTLFILGIISLYFIYIPLKAKSYYNLGYKYLEKNKIEEAQKYYKIALNYKIYPDQIIKFSKKYLELGYYKIAAEKAKYAISLKPNRLEYYFVLSDIYFAQKFYDKSIKLLENLYANAKFSRKPELYLEIGKKYEKLKQYQDAVSTYVEGIRIVGANKDIYFRLLDNSIKLDNVNASRRVYDMIFRLNEKFIDDRIFTDYAALLLKHKKDFEAADVMDRVKKHNKYYAPVYFYYAIFYKNRRKPDEALNNLKYAEQIINLGYSDKTFLDKIYNFIGEIYFNKGEKYYPESYNYFNKAITENPDNPKPYYNLGKIYYFYTNQYNIALENLLKAEKLGYTDDLAEYMKGWIFYQMGKYNSAIKRFIVLQQKYINNINLKLAVGNTFIKLKKPELAIGFLESIVSYWQKQKSSIKFLNIENPDIARIFVNLSVAYNNLGVAYQMLAQTTRNTNYSSKALQYFLKSEEEYSKSNINFQVNSEAKINSLYILHPDIKRQLLLMDSKNYFPNNIFNEK